MTVLEMLALVAASVVTAGVGATAWIRWRRWRGEEQDTRLLTGIVDLRRRFREGDLDGRLPAKGRGFARDVETAVNRLLDEASVHLRQRLGEAAALAQALDALGGAVARTVERLEATAGQIELLGAELGQRASTAVGGPPFWDALEALRADDARVAEHSRTAATLADHSRDAAARCQGALEQLRATLADLARQAAGTTEGGRALQKRWTEVRTGIEGFVQAAGSSEVLAVNAALAAGGERDGRAALERFAAEADEVAHDATRALARITAAAADCEEPLARLVGAGEAERWLGVATVEASELDGALGRIQDLPPSLAAIANALAGVADLQAQAVVDLSAARPDVARLADELGAWTTLARRIGSDLTHAAGLLTAARREAQRLLEKEVAP